jgi:2-methylcitrate dehydratase
MIDKLRTIMTVEENQQYTKDYIDPEKRAIGNSVLIKLKNGDEFFKAIDYPIGHKKRRKDGRSVLLEKFENNLKQRFSGDRIRYIQELFEDVDRLEGMTVPDFLDIFKI